ncbi:hypothetical protein WKI72_18325 [Candidatus Erwinia dacicola]
MAKHFTLEFKLEAAKLVVDHGYTCRYRCKTGPPADVNLTHPG